MKSKAVWAGAMVAAGAATAVAAFKIGEEFDSAYDKIRVGTGKTGKVLEKLKGDFREVVRGVPTDFDSAATAVTELHKRLDLTGRPLQKLSKQLLELSRITGTDIATNTREVTRLFGDWSIATKDQSKTLDGFFRLSQKTGIEVGELASTLVQFGSPLRTLGLDFDFAAAMVARFEKEGVNMTTLMSGLRLAVANLSDPTDELKDRFKEMGITAKEPAEAVMQVMEAIEKTGSVTKGNTLAFEVFGRRAGADMAAAIREGRFELDEYLKAMQGGGDTIRKAGRDTMDFSEHLQKFKNNVLVELEPVAVRVFEAVGSAMKTVTKIMSDPDLSGGEKFRAFLDLISNAISEAVPKLIELGGKAAAAVVRGFLNSGVWGAIAVGALVFKMLGGVKALGAPAMAAGATIATRLGAGIKAGLMRAGIAGLVVAGLEAVFTSGGILDTIEGQGATWGRKLADAVAETLGPGVAEAIQRRNLPALRALTQAFSQYADQVAEVDDEASAELREHADKAQRALERIQKKIADVRHDIGAFGNTWGLTMGEIRRRTDRNMRTIEQTMGRHSRKGRIALADNFNAAAKAVQNSIDTQVIDSKKGYRLIDRFMMQALRAYGIKNPKVVLQETERRANAPVARRAGGGVPIPGQGSGDKVPVSVGGIPVALTEPGERMFILNRNANSALDRLQKLNKVVPRQAGGFVDLWGKGLAHLQSGGLAGMQPEATKLAEMVLDRFGGSIGSGLRSGDPGFHGRGQAFDWSGGDWAGAARFINSIGPKLLEGIYTGAMGGPQVSWDSGTKVPSSFWGAATWGAHGDHIHAAIGSMIKGAAAMMERIKLPRFEALTQFATSSAQALNNLSFGLEQRLNRGLAGSADRDFAFEGEAVGGDFLSTSYGPPWGGINGTGVTYTGVDLTDSPQIYGVAVDPDVIPLGSKLRIQPNPFGYDGLFRAFDTGGAIQGNRIDFYDWRGRDEQLGWGERKVNVEGFRHGGLVPGFKEGGIVGLIDRFVGDYKSTEGAGDRRNLISETAKRIKDSKQLGVDSLTPEGDLAGTLQTLRDEADRLGEWASNAGSLSDTDAEGNEIPGLFQEHTEAEWIAGPGDLRGQLEALFELRNALTTAMEAIERTREKVRKMIERAKKQLEKVQGAIKRGKREQRQLEKKRRQLEKDLEDASNRKERDNKHIQARLEDELAKPPKKRDERRIAQLRERLHSRSSEKDAIRDDLARNSAQMAALAEKQAQREKLRDALKGPISEALTGRNSALTTGSDTVLSELSSVQGSGMDTGFLPELPGLGVLGGEIFDAQSALARLGAEQPEISDTETAEAPEGFSISELMDFVEAIRYGVFDQDLISQMPAMHGGGVVGGAPGTQEVIRKLELGEGVIDAGTMQSGLRQNIYADLYIGGEKIAEHVRAEIREKDRSDRAAYTAGRAG